jgi:pilus assembly protein CpaD
MENMNVARGFLLVCSSVATLALGGCLQPPRGMPDPSVIGYDGHDILPPDCKSLKRPSLLLDGGVPQPSVAWGCATYTNLAAQVADPQDLVAPHAVGPADAAVAASAVRRYESGHVTPLDQNTTLESQ